MLKDKQPHSLPTIHYVMTGKGSFSFAWVTDEASAEREHGITIDLAERYLTSLRGTMTTNTSCPWLVCLCRFINQLFSPPSLSYATPTVTFRRQLQTAHRLLTIIDSPGHRDFVPTMVRGAAQADVAILVVSQDPRCVCYVCCVGTISCLYATALDVQ